MYRGQCFRHGRGDTRGRMGGGQKRTRCTRARLSLHRSWNTSTGRRSTIILNWRTQSHFIFDLNSHCRFNSSLVLAIRLLLSLACFAQQRAAQHLVRHFGTSGCGAETGFCGTVRQRRRQEEWAGQLAAGNMSLRSSACEFFVTSHLFRGGMPSFLPPVAVRLLP